MKIASHPILLSKKSYFINYTIPFYNISNILKLYFFPFYLNILFYLFILIYYFSFSLSFPLFLPQPLASATTNKTKTVQHTITPIATTPPPCQHQHIVTPTYPSTTHWTIKPKPKPH